MIKVFRRKNLLSQSLVKNDHFIKENHKICIFSTIIYHFVNLYKEISINFDENFKISVEFIIRMPKMYLKLNFIAKNNNF